MGTTPLRLLWIDDEPGVIDSWRGRLAANGFVVEAALDAQTGLALARGGAYDAILLDQKLPDMPGIRVLEQLRAAGIKTPVAMLTAYGGPELAFEAGSLGAAAYFEKPPGEKLVEAILGLVELSRTELEFCPCADNDIVPCRVRDILAEPFIAGAATRADDEPRQAVLKRLAQVLTDSGVAFCQFLAAARAFRLAVDACDTPAGLPQAIQSHLQSVCARCRAAADSRVRSILVAIDEAGDRWRELSETKVAREIGMSAASMSRLLHDRLGLTFRQCRRLLLVRRALLEVSRKREQVAQTAYGLGYSHPSVLNRQFRWALGITPRQFRELVHPA